MATAAKAKLLLRELKTVKADLAFAKQRCSQLEEENKMLRESREKGSNVDDDDLVMHSCTSLCFYLTRFFV
jgi:cell shape-determining protein MreC